MGFIDQKGIEARLAPLKEKFGENSDELWAERLKVEAEHGMMLFKRPIVRCKAVLHVRDSAPLRTKGELFKLEARAKCAFRAQDAFIVHEKFHGLLVEGLYVRAESQTPIGEPPKLLAAFRRYDLSSGWKMDTLGRDDIMSFYLRAQADVENVRFSVLGLAMPLDCYDEKKFWRVTKPAEPYDVTSTAT